MGRPLQYESDFCMPTLLGMLDMLLDTDLNLTQKDYAQTAQVCGRTLISLINEVLDRAKIEAGKLEIESVPFDLRSILDDVISLFSAKSREKGIEVSINLFSLLLKSRVIICCNLGCCSFLTYV